jgi:hypothetical protein
MTRIVAGLFDKQQSADLVVEHLVQQVGIPRERIQVHAADPATGDEARSPQDNDQEAALSELGLPERTVQTYGEGMRRGRILLVAWVDNEHAHRALTTYHEYSASCSDAYKIRQAEGAGDPEHAVRLQAYYLWQQEGCPEGRDLEFWHRARAAIGIAARAPQDFAGETGAAPLPVRGHSAKS